MAEQLFPRRIRRRILHEMRGNRGRMVEQLLPIRGRIHHEMSSDGRGGDGAIRRRIHHEMSSDRRGGDGAIRGRIHHEMSSDRTGGDGGSHTVTIGTPTNEMVPTSKEKDEQLLPGIPNDVTLNHIVTKLPWRALYILPLVSPSWQRAIQSRRVRDARVRTHSTETLVVHYHKLCGCGEVSQRLAMFSMRDKRCYELPPIPRFDGGIPNHWKCVSLDGKVYVLGGMEYNSRCQCFVGPEDGNELYVFDLVGQRHWKRCASMQRQRYGFGCGAVNGKIYVFGGETFDAHWKLLPGFEVYDPSVDVWSEIMPMPRLRVHPLVEIIGDELYVHGGACYEPHANRRVQVCIEEAKFGDVYHLVKDEWRVIDTCERDPHECVFVSYGQFYSMTGERICTYDSASNSWKELHSNSFPAVGPIGSIVLPRSAVGINDELLALLVCFTRPGRGAYFVKSKGFGRKGREVTWEIVSKCPSACGEFMFSIQL